MNDTGNPIVKKFIDSTPDAMQKPKKKSKAKPRPKKVWRLSK